MIKLKPAPYHIKGHVIKARSRYPLFFSFVGEPFMRRQEETQMDAKWGRPILDKLFKSKLSLEFEIKVFNSENKIHCYKIL